ncbi:hypothetical protein ACKC5Q_23590, partial [Aeromonas dhakensis]|uniref:hypothetical protein n=1 Tax=Aeromonas dhakensis TaxID=196024 RepID=UPI0038B64232
DRTESARQRFDAFRERVDAAVEPFRRLYEWMGRIIDRVPELPSREDIPVLGRFMADGEESDISTEPVDPD